MRRIATAAAVVLLLVGGVFAHRAVMARFSQERAARPAEPVDPVTKQAREFYAKHPVPRHNEHRASTFPSRKGQKPRDAQQAATWKAIDQMRSRRYGTLPATSHVAAPRARGITSPPLPKGQPASRSK